MLKLLEIFVLNLLSESLLLGSDFLGFSSIFFFDGFNHVIQFFQMIMVSLFHFLSFCEKLSFKDSNISSELLHESLHSGLLDGEQGIDVDEMISDGDLILVIGLV